LSLAPAVLAMGAALRVLVWHLGRHVGHRARPEHSRPSGSTARESTSQPATAALPLTPSSAATPSSSWSMQTLSWDLLLAGVVISAVGVHFFYWMGDLVYGPRYYFEATAALALLSARGLWHLSWAIDRGAWVLHSYIPRRARAVAARGPLHGAEVGASPARGTQPSALAQASVLALVAGLFAHSFTSFVPEEFARYRGWYGIDRSGVRAVEQARLEHALVFVAQQAWVDYAPFFAQNAPTLDGNLVFAIDHGPRNALLMELYPDRSYYRFAEGELLPVDLR
jgi:hypothetical protein